jgi:hypothetical protein
MAFDPTAVADTGTSDLENTRQPFLRILQSNSPELRKNKPNYIEGAKEGDIMFAPEKKAWASVEAIPVAFKTCYTEWIPRSKGGGIVGTHPMSLKQDPKFKTVTNETGKKVDMIGDNEAVRTNYCFLMFKHPEIGEWINGVIGFVSTQIKLSGLWQEKLMVSPYEDKSIPNLLYGRSWTITTTDAGNEKGDWKNWDIKDPVVLDFKKDEAILTQGAERREASQMAISHMIEAKPQQAQIATSNTTVVDDSDEPF